MGERITYDGNVVGVCFNEDIGKWCAYICVDYKDYFLGYYEKIEDATAIRKEAGDNLGDGFLDWLENFKKIIENILKSTENAWFVASFSGILKRLLSLVAWNVKKRIEEETEKKVMQQKTLLWRKKLRS